MKQTVARVSEDELSLTQWEFVASPSLPYVFKLVSLKRWQRSCLLSDFHGAPVDLWQWPDLQGHSNIPQPLDVPESIMDEAKRFILSRIEFKI